jgi:putative transposase
LPFWKCYYHLVWTTKHRQPIITPERERIIFATVRRVADDLKSEVWAINGTSDHIHVAASIPPGVAVAEWVKRCKGASSYMVNKSAPAEDRFGWQAGYSVLTFGQKVLPFVVAYITNQKQHHANSELQPYLERTED